jgi:thiamine-phosphate pyrophosphorylase
MLRCYITDRHALAPGVSLLDAIARADADWVQIREKDLSARALHDVVKAAIPLGKKVIVNSRMDVALAAGAAGLHLPADSIPPDRWRAISPRGFLIGVSCHTLGEVRKAAEYGADYVFFGPVFAPLSKASSLAPRGLAGLRHAARAVRIPVFALGGVTRGNMNRCVEQGAAGIAAISLYQRC